MSTSWRYIDEARMLYNTLKYTLHFALNFYKVYTSSSTADYTNSDITSAYKGQHLKCYLSAYF